MILVWGVLDDSPTQVVYAALRKRGIPLVLVDHFSVANTFVDISYEGILAGRLVYNGEYIPFDRIEGAYFRTYDWRQYADEEDKKKDTPHAAEVQHKLVAWGELTDAVVVNRMSYMASNASKPYQTRIIRKSGFRTPDTIVTTDPAEVLLFKEKHGEIIYKSISSVRSIVTKLSKKQLAHLSDVKNCPTQFQQWVPGVDHRVHVAGERVFGARIETEAVDYRYARQTENDIKIAAWEVPDDLAEKCVELTHQLGLLVSGIDLRLTPDLEWYCFEVNPSPAFTFYENWTEERISEAVVDLLLSSRTGMSHREIAVSM